MTEPPVQTGVDEVHAHAHKTGHHWIDLVIAVSAITISVISLIVAVEHGEIERRLVAANSWPFLDYNYQFQGIEPGRRRISLHVINAGVGPARIQSAVMRLNGRPIHGHGELMSLCCGLPRAAGYDGQIRAGMDSENSIVGVLPARGDDEVFALREQPGNVKLFDAMTKAHGQLSFEVCYCSVLDECWTTDLKSTTTPKRVGQCHVGGLDEYGE